MCEFDHYLLWTAFIVTGSVVAVIFGKLYAKSKSKPVPEKKE